MISENQILKNTKSESAEIAVAVTQKDDHYLHNDALSPLWSAEEVFSDRNVVHVHVMSSLNLL